MTDKMKALMNAKQIVWIGASCCSFTKNKTYLVREDKKGRYITTDDGCNIRFRSLDTDCWEILGTTSDPINHPAHYTTGNIEVIDFIEDKGFGYHLGNAIKYISRAGIKDKSKEVEDLKKAVWYIKRHIENISKNKQHEQREFATNGRLY